MKTVGIIGGIGPESTIEYYRQIIAAYRQRQGGTGVSPVDHAQDARTTKADPGYPSIIINSVDVSKLLAWMEASETDAFTDYLVNEIEKLSRAGADFGVLAANTPHIVFDELRRRSQIPLVSIVEATCDEARSRGLKRVALFGTRFTMQGRFYPEVFSKAGITIVVPSDDEQAYIHDIYTKELLNNIFLPETHDRLTAIMDRMKASDTIEAVILGGTELPLLLRDPEHNGIPFLDTTRIHVNRIVAELVS
jgi:aspartate racemase